MYEPGSLILYGSTGVCRVVNIFFRKSADGGERPFYTLKPLYDSCTISAPADSDKVFMRPIITRGEALELISIIPETRGEIYNNRVLRQLAEHYESSLNTHDCRDLVELTKSIYAKKLLAEQEKRRFGAIDERYMKRAEALLFGELAAALEIALDEVPDYIEKELASLGS